MNTRAFASAFLGRLLVLALMTAGVGAKAAPTAAALMADASMRLAAASGAPVLVFGDGDNDPDIWVGGTDDGREVLLTQTSDARWMRHTLAIHAARALSGVTLDANNDFARDLAVARTDGVHLFLNDGKGELHDAGKLRGCPGDVHQLLAADLNGDGRIDLLGLTDRAPCLWLNQGADARHLFAPAHIPTGLPLLAGVRASALTDIDNDGHLDLVVVGANGARVYEGDGLGHFPRTHLLSSGDYDVVAPGDFNNDGRMDVFLASANGTAHLVLNEGRGRFRERTIAWHHGPIRSAIATDLDNTGQLGLLVSTNSKAWRLDPRSGKVTPLASDNHGEVVAVADLDRDGRMDWVERDRDGTLIAHRNHDHIGHWVSIQLRGADERAVSGARVVLTLKDGTVLTRIERAGTTHHLGIGRRTEIDEIQVFWPSGRLSQIPNPPIDRHLGFLEPTGADAVVQRAKPIFSVMRERVPHPTIYCK